MHFLVDVLQVSPIVKNCYFMDGKAEKDNCAWANKGTTFVLKNKRKKQPI